MMKKLTQLSLIAIIAIAITACGGEKTTEKKTDDTPKTETKNEEVKKEEEPKKEESSKAGVNKWENIRTEDVKATLTLSAGDDMMYTPTTLEAEAYTYVQLDFTNVAKGAGMNHNAVIVDNNEEIVNSIIEARIPGTFEAPQDDRIYANTAMLLPGESTSIGFETPGPGEYLIICTFPGHTTMRATLTVK